jgi:Glycine zipper
MAPQLLLRLRPRRLRGTIRPAVHPRRAAGRQELADSRQQQTDRGQCYTWAVQQSGFDPANPRVPGGPAPAVGVPQGGLFRGAAGGAALGAIGGAIGGNAGKGAAIGAGTGAVFGGMRRRRWAEREEFQQTSYLEQQQSALNQGRGNFNQAFGVCMTGRGYTVG